MLMAIIDARSAPMALTATLGPLVRGVVEGIIGTAILINPTDDPDIRMIADSSGCRVLLEPQWTDGFARAVTHSSGAGVLVLDAGVQLGPDFWPLLADNLPALGNRPAASLPALAPGMAGLASGALYALKTLGGRPGRNAALLLPPRLAREIGQAKSDPFQVRYGKELARLKATVTRVDLG
jgi:hypothetical protein